MSASAPLVAPPIVYALRRALARPLEAEQAQRLVRAWLALAVGALTMAGLFVLPVLGARLPFFQELVSPETFRVALAGHVTFSLNVWLLGYAALLWTAALARRGAPLRGWAGAGPLLALAGMSSLAASVLFGAGSPVLADYVPVLDHPLFLAGLALFFVGVGTVAVHYLAHVAGRTGGPAAEDAALQWAALAFIAALPAAATAWSRGVATAQGLAWGPGHLFQVVHTGALLAAWCRLFGRPLPAWGQAVLRAVLPLLAIPAVAIPWLYALPGPVRAGEMALVTWWATGVPLTVALVVLTAEMLRRRQRPDAALLWSMLFLVVGGLVALGGLLGDVRVTAHYHSTVGAVTIAYMGLTYRLLGLTARRALATLARSIQLLLYGGGVGLLVSGLFWAGLEGSARKAFESFGGRLSLASPAGLVMLGGTVAALGGVWFISAAAWQLAGRSWSVAETERI
jgi:hypothetical protein